MMSRLKNPRGCRRGFRRFHRMCLVARDNRRYTGLRRIVRTRREGQCPLH